MLITATEHPQDDIETAVWHLGTDRSLAKLMHKINHHALWKTLMLVFPLKYEALSKPKAPAFSWDRAHVSMCSVRWSTATL